MKTLFKTAVYLFALLMAGSCVLDKIDSQPATDPRLECDALESYTIQANKPQDISFRVSATTPWTITGFESASWLSVEPASSAVSSLSEDIRIKAVANPNLDDRTVTITIKGENTDINYTVKLTQLRKGKLTVTPIADDFSASGNSQTFKVESNLDWAVSAADEWLSISPAKGTGDGSMKATNVTATASANESLTRSTTVTVTSGDEIFEFTATQKGQSLEFTDVENTELDSKGQEVILNVDATMDWTVSCDNADFTVTKEGNDKVKVVAPWNGKFAPRTVTVTIKPTSSSYGDVSSSVTLSQDINFKLEGNCEVLSDGSVKVTEGELSHIVLKDGMRYGKVILTMGDVHFAEKAEMWYVNVVGDKDADGFSAQLYNWLTVGKTRVRAEGSIAGGHGLRIDKDSYFSQDYSITLDELNAMKSYEMDIYPDSEDPTHLHMDFIYNGEVRCAGECMNPFYGNTLIGSTYVGPYTGNTTADTWFVVKSFDFVAIAE